MRTQDTGELRDAAKEEKQVEGIRAAALRKVQLLHPEIKCVIDRRTIDDYCCKQWDYPGAWYSRGFKLPDGFGSTEALIDAIAEETIRYFTGRKEAEHGLQDRRRGR